MTLPLNFFPLVQVRSLPNCSSRRSISFHLCYSCFSPILGHSISPLCPVAFVKQEEAVKQHDVLAYGITNKCGFGYNRKNSV